MEHLAPVVWGPVLDSYYHVEGLKVTDGVVFVENRSGNVNWYASCLQMVPQPVEHVSM